VLSVGRELELEQALQRILESTAELVDARYGALAVLGQGGTVATSSPPASPSPRSKQSAPTRPDAASSAN
jgi:hypothetical protein